MEKIWKNFGVSSSKLKYPKHAVVIEGTKSLIVDRLNDSSPATYSELYSFSFIWRKFERILERIWAGIWKNFREYLKRDSEKILKIRKNFVKILKEFER